MAYWITAFGGVSLPTAQPVQDTGLGAAAIGATELPGGGVHDPWGSAPAPVKLPYQLSVEAILRGTDSNDLRSKLYALRALHGQRLKLYRTPDGGTLNSEWVWARLETLSITRQVENRLHIGVTMNFLVLSDPWSGTDRTINTVLDAVPKYIVCPNNGNAQVNNAVITITAKGGAISLVWLVVTVSPTIMQWKWTGTLAVNSSLRIDCGARTVRVNGVDDYAHFALDSSHNVSEWLRLAPGNTTVAVTRSGGDATSTVQIAYADGWR